VLVCASASPKKVCVWRATAIQFWIKRGRVIGWVTSCAVDSEGLLTGQAFLELETLKRARLIYIYWVPPISPVRLLPSSSW
jgi:hypothetical protein